VNRNIYLLFSSRSVRSFTAGFLSIAFSLYLYDQLKMPIYDVGLVFAAGALATPIMSLLVGALGDRYGRKIVLFVDLLTLPLALVVLMASSSLPAILLASALGGFGVAGGLIGGGVGASVGPVVTALLAENAEGEERTKLYALNSALSTFSGAAGAAFVSSTSYMNLFKVGAILSLASALIVLPVNERFQPSRGMKRPSLTEADTKVLRAFAVTGVVNGASQGLLTPFYPIIFEHVFGLTVAQVGILMMGGGILTGVSDFFTVHLARNMGFLNLIMTTRAASATAVLLLPFAPNAASASALYLIMTPLRAVSLPAQTSLQMALVSEGARGRVGGLNQAARLLAAAAATYSGGIIMTFMPFFAPFLMASGLTYANSALYYTFFGKFPQARRKRG